MSLTISQTSNADTASAPAISAYAMTDATGRVYEQAQCFKSHRF